MNIFKNRDVKNAFMIGTITTIVYLACYFAKNILSIISPQMVENAGVSLEYIGTLSTANMLFYAGGQLINGIIGDKIKGKYMIGGGLALAGLCNIAIGLIHTPSVMLIAYSASGFFLSTLYAPIVKLIAENTLPEHAEKCCLGLNFASLFGVPVAGIVAFFFNWMNVFLVCGIILTLIGLSFYFSVVSMEKRGIIHYPVIVKEQKKGGGFKILLENAIIKFTLISVLTGIVRTSVAFWVPTYLSQYLGFTATFAATIYTVMTVVQSVSPYLTNVVIYEYLLKRNMNRMLLWMFGVSAVSFMVMFIVPNSFINIVFLTLAIMTANGAANTMWNVYCPSLHHTGMVSTATGYLDFMSYLAAGIANKLFANAISQIGWGNLILVWSALMGAGVVVTIPWKKRENVSDI